MAYGTLYIIVGPTGSGKQALIDTVLEVRGDIRRAPLIVSAQNSDNPGVVGSIAPDRFRHLMRDRAFALQWDCDGLRYGFTHDAARQLRDGQSLIISCDMAVLEEAQDLFPHTRVIYVTARIDILRRRLCSMNYGSEREIDMHISQAMRFRPRMPDMTTVDTSDSIAAGARAMVQAIGYT